MLYGPLLRIFLLSLFQSVLKWLYGVVIIINNNNNYKNNNIRTSVFEIN